MSDALKLEIINIALVNTGNNRLSALNEGTEEGIVALLNYDLIVEKSIEENPWFFASKSEALSLLAAEATLPFKYRWQLPSSNIVVRRIEHAGAPLTEYEIEGDVLRVSHNDDITLLFIYKVAEGTWPPSFKGIVVDRLEAVFRRSLNEQNVDAERDDNRAARNSKFARSTRSRQVGSRETTPSGGPLVTRRRHG